MKKRPLILLSNDDGFEAKGLVTLIAILRKCGDLVVVAPDSGRSGMSCAITVASPLRMKLITDEEGLKIYKSNGTPADCIKLALNQLFKEVKPDLVVSGINHGMNSSVAIHYSGTMGAVLEACMNGFPALGFSLDNHSLDADFEVASDYIYKITQSVIDNGLPRGCCLNVNIPSVEVIKGVKICRQASGRWIEEFDKREHPKGGYYYWLTGNFHNDEPDEPDTDMHALREGFISVVPSQIDMTCYKLMDKMKNWNL